MIPTDISADARALADRLLSVPVGETIEHPALSAVIGRPVAEHRHLLYTAIRLCQREAGAIFVSVRGVGYRRLDANSVPETVGTFARSHLRRTARRARKAIQAGIAHANDLPDAVKRRAAAEISAFSLMEHLTRDALVKAPGNTSTAPEPVAITARRMLAAVTGA